MPRNLAQTVRFVGPMRGLNTHNGPEQLGFEWCSSASNVVFTCGGVESREGYTVLFQATEPAVSFPENLFSSTDYWCAPDADAAELYDAGHYALKMGIGDMDPVYDNGMVARLKYRPVLDGLTVTSRAQHGGGGSDKTHVILRNADGSSIWVSRATSNLMSVEFLPSSATTYTVGATTLFSDTVSSNNVTLSISSSNVGASIVCTYTPEGEETATSTTISAPLFSVGGYGELLIRSDDKLKFYNLALSNHAGDGSGLFAVGSRLSGGDFLYNAASDNYVLAGDTSTYTSTTGLFSGSRYSPCNYKDGLLLGTGQWAPFVVDQSKAIRTQNNAAPWIRLVTSAGTTSGECGWKIAVEERDGSAVGHVSGEYVTDYSLNTSATGTVYVHVANLDFSWARDPVVKLYHRNTYLAETEWFAVGTASCAINSNGTASSTRLTFTSGGTDTRDLLDAANASSQNPPTSLIAPTPYLGRIAYFSEEFPDRVYFSDVDSAHLVRSTKFVTLGEPASAMISPSLGKLLVLSDGGTFMLAGDPDDDDFSMQTLVSDVGCASPQSLVVANGKAYWFGGNGFYRFDPYRGTVREVSLAITGSVERLDRDSFDIFSGVAHPRLGLIIWSVRNASDSGTALTRSLVYSYKAEIDEDDARPLTPGAWSEWSTAFSSYYNYGAGDIPVGVNVVSSTMTHYALGGTDLENIPYTDNGASIPWSFTSGYQNFGSLSQRKLMYNMTYAFTPVEYSASGSTNNTIQVGYSTINSSGTATSTMHTADQTTYKPMQIPIGLRSQLFAAKASGASWLSPTRINGLDIQLVPLDRR